jgi:KaiC/GvpD/RAD55 family RecA-like ATPase
LTTIDSLLSEPVGSVLIEGGPGTGKTTFAIELLRKAGRGIYISTRVSKERLLEQIPTVKELIVGDGDGGGNSSVLVRMEDSRLATVLRVVHYLVQLEKQEETRLIVLDSWDAIANEIPSVERLKTEKSLLVIAEARNSKLVFISEESGQTSLNYLVDAVVELEREMHDGAVVRTLELKKLRGSPILNPRTLFTLVGARYREFEPVSPSPVELVKR